MPIELYYLLLLVTGFVAGIINTLAGGGSNLTVPALMVMGMPADVANATNRVGVLFQSVSAVRGFHQHGKLPWDAVTPIVMPTLIGGALGALAAVFAPNEILKPLLLGTMIAMALVILISPSVVAPGADEKPKTVAESPLGLVGLLFAGFYGGFVQAGVGFVLLAAITGALRFDLVRANALKVICALGFTLVALIIFIIDDLVAWVPGLVLAVGAIFGAQLAVKFAIKVEQRVLKWFLLVMTLVASAAALLSG
ncbi:sulfite exporter TauE/SafE family protein [Simiduia sp. 21SJ11W-1]|uniref:sulfite exporter TauE/SafE family protein n=1 Tax=Simiduia sp. 21SJ11W-1 TaxID=2909669 RepID=UPI0020A09E1E|nr:sulfite exporter TauE/SafE family protein [Simiduia sp. 21SJ11W-1]UTA49355.1 sulfite exporter TauE/SafE family protein [Simiduia sp. 21SJ11W-1]